MKVPVLDALQVAPRSDITPSREVTQPGGFDSLRQAGAEAGRAADSIYSDYEKAQHEARVSDARDGLTQLGDASTDTFYGTQTPNSQQAGDAAFAGREESQGFLALRGKDAAAQSADTIDELEQQRQKIAEGLKDPQTKKLFLQESAQLMVQAHRTVEEHVSREVERAKDDSITNAADEAVRAAAADPANDEKAQQRIANVVGAVHGLGRGKDFEEFKNNDVQQKVAATRISGLLAKNDVANAERVFKATKGVLGTQADDFERAIGMAKDKVSGETLAASTVDSARKPNGFIDEAKAVAAFEDLPADLRNQSAKAAFDHRLTLEAAREKSVKSDQFDTALTAYLQNHNANDVPPQTKAWLIANDPKGGWHALEQIFREDRAHASGSPPTDGQRRAMTQFEVDLHDHPDKYAVMPEAEFNRTVWPQLSKNDRERAGALFAQAHGQAAKPGTLDPAESKMLLEAGRKQGLFPDKQNDVSKWDDEAAQLYYKAVETLQEQSTAYRKLHGKAPPFDVVKKWTDDLTLEGKIPGKGFLGFGGGTTRLEAITKGTEFAPKWSEAERGRAVETLKKAGMQASDENIDTALRRLHGLPALPTKAPAAPAAPPNSTTESADWGLDLSTPAVDYGD